MAPVVHGLEKKYAGQIEFIYLDAVDSATTTLRNRLDYRAYPSFILLNDQGDEIARWVGKVNESEFTDAIDEMLSGG
ncbi:MAG: hypothetical protein CL789_03250 [Chloroflexi bacterium]|nr:hypothetical protein [Chloroflexota bacterium]HCU80142.1 hypothetical protein [Chloroflexota bacterium]|tara:strand:+ start:1317 stop:1547 length:231 start_codon:yes stop_codon:yes gene_type:complete